MSQCHKGKRFLCPEFVFRHMSFQERWGISRQGGISRKIINIPNKFIRSHVSKKKAGCLRENWAYFEKAQRLSRKVGSIWIGPFYKYQVYFRDPGMLYISMVISLLTDTALKKGDFWKVDDFFENCHKNYNDQGSYKRRESSQKKANSREQWPYLKNRVFRERN
jgi:hypothetical protein